MRRLIRTTETGVLRGRSSPHCRYFCQRGRIRESAEALICQGFHQFSRFLTDNKTTLPSANTNDPHLSSRPTMISYAQNFEDVLLERCFADVDAGFYIDIGANDPEVLSLTKHFYDRGWHGINVEPMPCPFDKLSQMRQRDLNLNMGIATQEGTLVCYEIQGQDVLSTFSKELADDYSAKGRQVARRTVPVKSLAQICAEYVNGPIQFMSIDVEGFERDVLEGADWQRCRPRVVVIEATLPNTSIPCHEGWEPLILAGGYMFAYFDGLNRFYVRDEDKALLEHFRVPVNIGDRVTLPVDLQNARLHALLAESASKCRSTEDRLALAQAKNQLNGACLRFANREIAFLQSELAAAEKRLATLPQVGPITLQVATALAGASKRVPGLARLAKGMVRGALSLRNRRLAG
jgi:FkbM family methyltransferase